MNLTDFTFNRKVQNPGFDLRVRDHITLNIYELGMIWS